MDEIFKAVAEYGLAIVGFVGIFVTYVKYVSKKDKEAEAIRKETADTNKERENRLLDEIKSNTQQLANITNTMNNLINTSNSLLDTNNRLYDKLDNDLTELKNDVKDIKYNRGN